MIDGLDGSGKSTIIETYKKYLTGQGNALFDLRQYWLENKKNPDLDELRAYDFIFSCEPTYSPMGRIIREELINKNKNYPALAIAHSYSIDRLILYVNLIIPMLNKGKCVISDRGVSTSLSYQVAHGDNLTMNEIASLPGNSLTLKHRPDHLIIADVSVQTAMERLRQRNDKHDDAIFEKSELLKKIYSVFHSDQYINLFQQYGTIVHFLPCEQKLDIMKAEAIAILKKILQI